MWWGLLAGCGPEPGFSLRSVHPEASARVRLNEDVALEFNQSVSAVSVNADAVRVIDVETGQLTPGSLHVEGRTVRFRPRLPCAPDLSDAGFQPGRNYRIELLGPPRLNGLRSRRGEPLHRGSVRTISAVTDAGVDAFVRRHGSEVLTGVIAATLSEAGDQLRLSLNDALDPRAVDRTRFVLQPEWDRADPDRYPELPATLEQNEPTTILTLTVPHEVRDLISAGARQRGISYRVARDSTAILGQLRLGEPVADREVMLVVLD